MITGIKSDRRVFEYAPRGAYIPYRETDSEEVKLRPWGLPGADGNSCGSGVMVDEIQAGVWEHLNPRPVVIPATHYRENRGPWIKMEPHTELLGMLAERKGTVGVYVVLAGLAAPYVLRRRRSG